jgi:formylglycine-generating enzyme required for sulfatase activity
MSHIMGGLGLTARARLGGEHRALRGGSYNNTATHCRVGNRNHNTPDNFNNNNGLRLVLGVAL